MIANYIAGPH